MEWQFRKILQNFDAYRSNSQYYISQIEKGSHNILKAIVRELQLVISEPKEKKISKVLAMRFAKDIMILGREDISNQLTKLVPHLLKVCSHRLDSHDSNRGETIFYDDPQYINGTEEQKKQLEIYGSTYFTLCLQSIYHWAKWIPKDNNNNQSTYLKGYNTLLQRGVKFQQKFHYYKNSDTEKFAKTYKVQFFSESSFNAISNDTILSVPSQRNLKHSGISKIRNIQQIQKYLENIDPDSRDAKQEIDQLYEQAIIFYEQPKTITSISSNSIVSTNNKKWLQNFLISYSQLKAKRIGAKQFLQRTAQLELQIDRQDEQSFSTDKNNKKVSAKRQQVSTQNKQHYEEMFQDQENNYRRKIDKYVRDIKYLEKQIDELKNKNDREIGQLRHDYEDRISILKQGIVEQRVPERQLEAYNIKIQSLQYQNQQLKNNLQNKRQTNEQQYQTLIQTLSIQNRKLHKEKQQLLKQLKVVPEMGKLTSTPKNINNLNYDQQLRKKNKKIEGLENQIKMYKDELKDERVQFQSKLKQYEKKIQQLENVVKEQKFGIVHLQKKLDLKELETAELSEQVRLCKMMDQQTNMMMGNNSNPNRFGDNEYVNTQNFNTNHKMTKNTKFHNFAYKKYEPLRNIFTSLNIKEKYLRFSRCCLKNKDILTKDNSLQVGIITQIISLNVMKIILHFTNISFDEQIQNLNIKVQGPPSKSVSIESSNEFIFCLQPQEQEKIVVKQDDIDRFGHAYNITYIQLNFKKKQKNYEHKLPLPFIAYKLFQTYKPNPNAILQTQHRQTLNLHYSKSMISDHKVLSTYFPSIQQTGINKYECELYQRDLKFLANLRLQFSGQDYFILHICPIVKNIQEQHCQLSEMHESMMYDLMSFMEFSFMK